MNLGDGQLLGMNNNANIPVARNQKEEWRKSSGGYE
jgi:hypothetical protein